MEKLKAGAPCVLCWEGTAATKGTVDEDLIYGDPEWICVPVHSEAEKQKLKNWALSKK